MNVMCTPEEPTSCNRRPFVSEDGCDRGNVDIHQFDELPYCGSINPTSPEIPPEVVDSPISLPVPPPCSCVNFDFKFPEFKYHSERTFSAGADFKAIGDCCEGNYRTDFNIKIPCPVMGDGEKKISVGIGYGDGDRKKNEIYVANDNENCTISPLDVNFDLEIPCPASTSGENTIKAEGRWAKGFSEASAKFVSVNREDCNIEFSDGKIDLDIACPIKGRGDNKISANIKYGNGGGRGEAVFMHTDENGCMIEGVDADIGLQIPCPVRGDGTANMKIGIGYGDNFTGGSGNLIRSDEVNCEITAEDTSIDLKIPCPLDGVKFKGENGITVKEGDKGTCFKEFILGLDMSGGGAIDIPCQVLGGGTKKITMSIDVAGNGATANADYITMNNGGCGITAEDANLEISLPCPISLTGGKKMKIGFDTIAYDGMPGTFDTINGGNLDDLGWSGLGVSSCNLTLNKKLFKLKALPPTNSERLSVACSYDDASDGIGRFYIDDSFESSGCKRNLKFDVKFPRVHNKRVVSEIKWENHALKYKLFNLVTGEEDSSYQTVFEAVAHTGGC